MAFLTGLLLIDAPASALNNASAAQDDRTENVVSVKFIRTRQGAFPYVSAQAFRYWLRSTLEQTPDFGWKAAPIFREAKIAYTDANPIEYWDDDLFGYMRAPSKKTGAAEKRKQDATRATETATSTEITRVSPFRVSTLISIAPVSITSDFGTMTRHEGDPVPHEHQFYHTVLKGLVSLNLHAAGTFSYVNRTGYRNLDDTRVEIAKTSGNSNILTEKKSLIAFPRISERKESRFYCGRWHRLRRRQARTALHGRYAGRFRRNGHQRRQQSPAIPHRGRRERTAADKRRGSPTEPWRVARPDSLEALCRLGAGILRRRAGGPSD